MSIEVVVFGAQGEGAINLKKGLRVLISIEKKQISLRKAFLVMLAHAALLAFSVTPRRAVAVLWCLGSSSMPMYWRPVCCASEVFGLRWPDVMYGEGLIAVRAKLKGGKMRYVPMPPELAGELQRYKTLTANDNNGRIFPPEPGATSGRQRLEGSFEDLLGRADIQDFRFHDLRHTFASWYMMNGGDLYELAKILGHSNIKTTERYAKLARQHIARTGSTAREIWKLMNPLPCVPCEPETPVFAYRSRN